MPGTRKSPPIDRARVPPPRFMTDAELREHFGLSERALRRLRLTGKFPHKDPLIGKTDCRVVDLFFDQRAGLATTSMAPCGGFTVTDGEEYFDD
jgi:hypothetical protein